MIATASAAFNRNQSSSGSLSSSVGSCAESDSSRASENVKGLRSPSSEICEVIVLRNSLSGMLSGRRRTYFSYSRRSRNSGDFRHKIAFASGSSYSCYSYIDTVQRTEAG